MTPRLVVEDVEKQRRIVSSTHDLSHFGVHRTNDTVSLAWAFQGCEKICEFLYKPFNFDGENLKIIIAMVSSLLEFSIGKKGSIFLYVIMNFWRNQESLDTIILY